MRRVVCTIATRRRLPQVRALAWSLRSNVPTVDLLVLVLDDRCFEVNTAGEPFAVVWPPSLGIARFELLAAMHAAPELELVITPAFLRYALDWADGPVLHLACDALVYASLERIFTLVTQRRLVLVPRICEPVPRDHVRLSDVEIARSGVFDRGCVALTPCEPIDAFLCAWSDRLEYDLGDEVPLASSRFLDFAPAFVEDAAVLRDPALGVSRLNLHERVITRTAARFEANQRALVLVHFDGLDGAEEPHPDPFAGPIDGGPRSPEDRLGTPQALREKLQRQLLIRHPALAQLVRERAQMLMRCGAADAERLEYGYARLADGTPLSRRLRLLVRDGERYGALDGSPFNAEGTHRLLAWLNGPAQRGGAVGVSRYWFEIYRERPDVQIIHSDLDGAGALGFLRWTVTHGRHEYAAPDALVPWDSSRFD